MKVYRGVTLIELIVVITILGILLSIALPKFNSYIKDLKALKEASQVYEDLRLAQMEALKRGGSSLVGGNLVNRRVFVVFDIPNTSYSVYLWEDIDGDGNPEVGESNLLFSRSLVYMRFSIPPGVTTSACAGDSPISSFPVTFQAKAYPPCNGNPCVMFHPWGFIEDPNGVIYMSYQDKTYAVSINRAGYIRLCKWSGSVWIQK